MPRNRSPRFNLRRALEFLTDFERVLEQHTGDQAEVVASLGADLIAEIKTARAVLERAVARVEQRQPPPKSDE